MLPALAGAGEAATRECRAAQVLRVHDGDTLTVRCEGQQPVKVRIAGIDAPELHQAYGRQARDALVGQIDGAPVHLRSRAVDRYERLVADVEVAGHDVGLQLVAEGFAWCGLRPTRACRQALDAARQTGRGLWADANPQPPWQWRRDHPRHD